MNTPVTEEELFELIKKYSFFYENDKNTFSYTTIPTQDNYEFIPGETTYAPCSFRLSKHEIKIKKVDSLNSEDHTLYQNIASKLNEIKDSNLDYHDIDSILSTVQLKTILQLLSVTKHDELGFILSHIKEMESWASQTYENQGICFCLGIDNQYTCNTNPINIQKLYNELTLKVMTSGIDTMLICNRIGNISEYITKRAFIHQHNSTSIENISNPISFQWLANWTNASITKKNNKRIVILLTTKKEILIFYKGQLKFTKRQGKWFNVNFNRLFYPPNSNIPKKKELQNAIIETCINSSFRRTGACIGILKNESKLNELVDERDLFSNNNESSLTKKIKFLQQIVSNEYFYNIPRELRQEIVAFDGATVLNNEGKILAIGAILNIKNNPSANDNERRQGGRSTAAKQLAHHGLGIKVSADGGITAWQQDKNKNNIYKFFELF